MVAKLARLKGWARRVKLDVHALWLAARDPRTPWGVRVLAFAVAAYAVSPVDLIPDFIPVVGLLDEAILLPLAIALLVRLVPASLMEECRARAASANRPVSRIAGAVILVTWGIGAAVLAAWAWRAAGL